MLRAGLLLRRTLSAGGVVSIGLLVQVSTGSLVVQAQTVLNVTGQGDGPGTCTPDGNCPTLRAAVTQANADSGDTIRVPSGTYALKATLELTGTMTINGASADNTFVDGGKAVRVFAVGPQANVTIFGLTVRNGKIGKDEFGAGIRNEGTLTLNDVTVTGNDALDSSLSGNDGFGGGIASAGNLTLNRGLVSHNRALTGGGILTFPVNDPGCPLPGEPRYCFGPASVNGTRIESNNANLGGGIAAFSPFQLNNVTLDAQNTAAFGGGLLVDALVIKHNPPLPLAECFCGIVDVSASTIDDNSAGFHGGGVFVGDGASIRIATSTLSNNEAGREGDGGDGGAIYNDLAGVGLTNDTLSANNAHDGGPNGTLFGHGGAIAQSTISGDVGPPVPGRPSIHGIVSKMGIAAHMDRNVTFLFGGSFATTSLDFVTIAGNSASQRGPGGGGIFNAAAAVSEGNLRRATLTIHDTIVAGNTGQNCVAQTPLVSSGYNLEDANSCGLSKTGDQTNANPELGKLTDNGGPTATMALSAGSPAVDAADPSCDVKTDQRGVMRPQGPRCDIGAFELQTLAPSPSPSVSPTLSPVPSPPVTGTGSAAGADSGLSFVGLLVGLGSLLAAGASLMLRRSHGA